MSTRTKAGHVSDIIGQWGPWQTNVFLFYFFCYILSPYNNLGISFHAPKVKFWCASSSSSSTSFQPPSSQLNGSSPCLNCTEFDYEPGYQSTIVSEWDLVCSRSWLPSLSQSFYQFGYVINGLLLGHLSDRFGRKTVLWLALTFEVFGGLSVIFSQSIGYYIASRFLLGLGDSGRGVCLYMILIETVGNKHRSDMAMAVSFGWVIGYLTLPGVAFFVRSFRYLQLIPTGLAILFLVTWLWSIPESPRWQLASGKLNKARSNILKAARINGKDIKVVLEKMMDLNELVEANKPAKKTIIDLLRRRTSRNWTLIFWFSFAVNAFIYHGISLNVEQIGGNVFVNFALAALVEIPSIVINMVGLRTFGRRPFIAVTMTLSAVANLLVVPLSTYSASLSLSPNTQLYLRVALTMTAKLFIFSSFNAIYIHASESFPTVLRHTAVGSCSIAARIGSVLAPFVKEVCEYFHVAVAMAIFGSLAMAAAGLTLLLPETKDQEIPDSIEQMEMMVRNKNTNRETKSQTEMQDQ